MPMCWRSIINVDCSAVIYLLPIAQNILELSIAGLICLPKKERKWNQQSPEKDDQSRQMENQGGNLSVTPTIAASAGTKLPIWERKTIKATWGGGTKVRTHVLSSSDQ